MTIGGPSATGTAGAVWTSSLRSLTNTGAMLTSTTATQQVFAANTVVDLRAAASKVGELSIAVLTGVGATVHIAIQMWDGSNGINAIQTADAAGVSAYGEMMNTSFVGPRLFNADATHAGNYMYSGLTWTL